MSPADMLGAAFVVCVFLWLLCCSSEAFTGQKSAATPDLVFRKDEKDKPAQAAYRDLHTVSGFVASLDDAGSIGHLNDLEANIGLRAIQNYDEPRDVQIDSRWIPDMAVQMDQRAATFEDIDSGNMRFGPDVEYTRSRWAENTECPMSYGISGDTYGKIVFGDESEHEGVRDNYRTPLIDDSQMVTYGDYARGSVSI